MSKTHGTVHSASELTGHDNLLTCHTLIDITRTGVVSNFRKEIPLFVDDASQIVRDAASWSRSRNQQRNFETIIQIISLRAQPVFLEPPKKSIVDLAMSKFGLAYTGEHTVWSFRFSVEHASVFDKQKGDLISLLTDMHNVPCITDLTETVNIAQPLFNTQDEYTNIYFGISK